MYNLHTVHRVGQGGLFSYILLCRLQCLSLPEQSPHDIVRYVGGFILHLLVRTRVDRKRESGAWMMSMPTWPCTDGLGRDFARGTGKAQRPVELVLSRGESSAAEESTW